MDGPYAKVWKNYKLKQRGVYLLLWLSLSTWFAMATLMRSMPLVFRQIHACLVFVLLAGYVLLSRRIAASFLCPRCNKTFFSLRQKVEVGELPIAKSAIDYTLLWCTHCGLPRFSAVDDDAQGFRIVEQHRRLDLSASSTEKNRYPQVNRTGVLDTTPFAAVYCASHVGCAFGLALLKPLLFWEVPRSLGQVAGVIFASAGIIMTTILTSLWSAWSYGLRIKPGTKTWKTGRVGLLACGTTLLAFATIYPESSAAGKFVENATTHGVGVFALVLSCLLCVLAIGYADEIWGAVPRS